jgi:aerobic-type carbon monoxide dehydrogenase small subunit (CoxS/CutS family)
LSIFTVTGALLCGYCVPNLIKETYLMFRKEKEVSVDDEQYPDADI